MDVTAVSIRAAEPDEARLLTEIAMRSKAHHGYGEAFMDAVAGELSVTRSFIADELAFVVDVGGTVAGFYGLKARRGACELDLLFIDPPFIGRGYGRLLFDHAANEARALGCREMTIDADPFAEPFYLALGAERAGEAPSGSIPGRMLPRLRFRL
jgi:GNAT superfamily N-acetyltransferase